MTPRPRSRLLVPLLALSALAAQPASAQRLLDWPIRVRPGAEATISGAAGAFWNPATIGSASTVEALIMDIDGFRESGLGGLALAASARIDEQLTIAAAVSHLGVDGIPRTETSPADELGEIQISEDVITVSAARRLGRPLSLGVSVQYARTNEAAGSRSESGLGAGIAWTPELRFQPTVGLAALGRAGATEWLAGAELRELYRAIEALRIGASYGLSGGASRPGLTHRAAFEAEWDRGLAAAAGFDGEAGATGTTWNPVLAASLRLGRYALGVLREQIGNGFGAAHYYRLEVRF